MKLLKKLLAALALVPAMTLASEGGFPLDRAPDRSNDLSALQNGARLFVNYCLNCHSASLVRYNRLRDIGLSEKQIQDNLLFTSDKVGDLMKVSLSEKDAKTWFGAVPPDLSVIVRAKASSQGSGADYVYTYLRTYYKDDARATGWNNLVYPNVGMPHVLWELQGVRNAKFVEEKDPHDASKSIHKFAGFEQVKPGKLSSQAYDAEVADLVGFMEWMSEPVKSKRQKLGVWVLLFMAGLVFLTWRLNASFWKEVK
ncbi:MAG: Cytochrome c1 precursor [Pseudomonadota bacterium]|jgi:ubiquinol-cytochrome c reductase cytochrome c1 subunit|nr:cytochrome c1 [Oxalobacteraceae bacterium]